MNTGGADKIFAVMGTGVSYRDTITVSSGHSGTNGHPFVLFARGDVTIDGSDIPSTWTADGSLYRAKVDGPFTPHQVYVGGVRYAEDTGTGALAVGRSRYRSGGDSVFINTGGSNPNSQSSYISQRVGITITGASYVTVKGFKVRRSNDDAITGSGWNECIVENCDVQFSWKQGIMFSTSRHATIRDNIACNNASHGIYLVDSDSSCVIFRNTVSGNDHPTLDRGGINGIRLGDRSTALAFPYITHEDTVEANVVFGNEDSGIEIRHNFVLSRYNQVWSNRDHGFDHRFSTNSTHVGDLVWGNDRDGLSFEKDSYQHSVRNCVIADNGKDPCRFDWEIELDNGSFADFTSDYNVIWRPTRTGAEAGDSILVNVRGGPQLAPDGSQCGNGNCISYPDSCFGTLLRYKTKYNTLDQHSQAGAPLFQDAQNGDFMPTALSSVIDAADTTVAGYKTRDTRGFVRHDYTGTGGTNEGYPTTFAYADIGPYEFDPPPGAVTISVGYGRYDSEVCWTASGEDADVGTAKTYTISRAPLASLGSGTANSPGSGHQVTFATNSCSSYDVSIVITENDNGQTSTSNIVSGNTACSGTIVPDCTGGGGFSARRSVGELGDEPFELAVSRPILRRR